MKNATLNWVRLPLEGIEDCRELGGYETEQGDQVSWHRFLRSSDLSGATEKDIRFLKEYGVTTVIDLGGQDEVEIHKSPLLESDFFDYYHIPFFDESLERKRLSGDLFTVELFDEVNSVKQIIYTMALAQEGTVIFQCSARKDYAGFIAMLLLGLVGVSKQDIISNYSDHVKVIRAYEHIIDNYGTFENYLLEKGVEMPVIERVKLRLSGASTVPIIRR